MTLSFFLFSPVDPPEIIVRPADQQVKNGGIAAFYCQATGDPSPVLQWRKNGKRVSGTQSRYLVQEYPVGGALLRIEPVRAQRDEAQYECVAENGVGDAVAADAMLKVYDSKYQEFLYFHYRTVRFL
jgi:netrin-G3 ligand